MELSVFSQVMRDVVGVLQYPVVAVLLVLLALSLVFVGIALAEWLVEGRHLRVSMPELVDDLRDAGGDAAELRRRVEGSGLLRRQKAALCELASHPALAPAEREALAVRLLEQEQASYDLKLTWTDTIAKLGPIFGLMGTLIPLGPGLIALGQGDTLTLSNSLLIAFDTTVTGLVAAALAMLVSTARKRWYRNYMSMLEALEVVVLEEAAGGADTSLAAGEVSHARA